MGLYVAKNFIQNVLVALWQGPGLKPLPAAPLTGAFTNYTIWLQMKIEGMELNINSNEIPESTKPRGLGSTSGNSFYRREGFGKI